MPYREPSPRWRPSRLARCPVGAQVFLRLAFSRDGEKGGELTANQFLGLIALVCFLVGLFFFYLEVIVAGMIFWFVTLYIVNIVLLPQWWRGRR